MAIFTLDYVLCVPKIYENKTQVGFRDGGIMYRVSKHLLAVLARDKCCVSCGLKPAYFEARNTTLGLFHNDTLFNLDHIIAKSKGGINGLSNYQLMCQPCNQKKGNATWIGPKPGKAKGKQYAKS